MSAAESCGETPLNLLAISLQAVRVVSVLDLLDGGAGGEKIMKRGRFCLSSRRACATFFPSRSYVAIAPNVRSAGLSVSRIVIIALENLLSILKIGLMRRPSI